MIKKQKNKKQGWIIIVNLGQFQREFSHALITKLFDGDNGVSKSLEFSPITKRALVDLN